jgi:hypothetical protein
METEVMTWEDLQNSGELEGYEDRHWNKIDAEVAGDTPCGNCGGQCGYIGLKNRHGSYRAFSVCQKCDYVIEF